MAKKKYKKKKQKRVRTKKRWYSDVPFGVSILFIFLGLILAVVFNLDPLYYNKTIDREEAVAATGHFESYKYFYSPKSGAVSEIRIYFSDREELSLVSYHGEMDEKFETLERGERLDMLLHPNSEYIWEISTEDGVMIAFDEIKSIARTENTLFSVLLGGFGLLCILMGSVALIVKCREYKKHGSK